VIRATVESISADFNSTEEVVEFELKGYILKNKLTDFTSMLSGSKDILLTSDSEQRDLDFQRSRRKSNPLMLNFEEYE
jgi:hypothetical protein